MGKMADALERYKKEKLVIPETQFRADKVERLAVEDRQRTLAGRLGGDYVLSNKLVVVAEPDSYEAESFKMLRAHLLFSKDRERPKRIMVTSALPGEGKTYVAANLAVSIALGIDEHVLLVDCDLRQPHLHKMFGFRKAEGLHEYLAGKRHMADLILSTRIDKLSMLAGGSVPPNPTELLSSRMMSEFVDKLGERYKEHFIVMDSTPSHFLAEASVLAKFVDGIIFVVRAGKGHREAILKSVTNLGKEKILGIVFNGYQRPASGYRKYYGSHYKNA
jgi:protein-tyrosine kinase